MYRKHKHSASARELRYANHCSNDYILIAFNCTLTSYSASERNPMTDGDDSCGLSHSAPTVMFPSDSLWPASTNPKRLYRYRSFTNIRVNTVARWPNSRLQQDQEDMDGVDPLELLPMFKIYFFNSRTFSPQNSHKTLVANPDTMRQPRRIKH